VQSIIRELRGEKIDIIEFNDDPVVFATHALSPAKISRVTVLDPLGKHMEVIVDDTQLSLAIGKKGQNVRLAAKLLGWRIDIKSEEEKRQEVESQMAALVVPGAPVSVLLDHGLAEGVVDKLAEAGIITVEKLGAMTPEELEEIPEIGPELVENIQQAVVGYYGQFEEAPSPPAASAAEGSASPDAKESDEKETAGESNAPAIVAAVDGAAESATLEAAGPTESGSEPVSVEASEAQSVTIDNKEQAP
jgi:N utilization substance protein A